MMITWLNRSWVLILVTLIPFACTHAPQTKPVEVSAIELPPDIPSSLHYLTQNQVAEFKLIPPPALDSEKEKENIRTLQKAQTERSDADCKRAQLEAKPINPGYQEFFGAIGPFSVPLHGDARQLINSVWADSALVANIYKEQYLWPRAFSLHHSIRPCLPKTSSAAYPSSHALISRLFALTLSDVDPGKKSIYLARADEIAHDRLLAGMHRPTELEAGKLLADQIHDALLKSELYLHDINKAKAEIQ